MSPSVENSLNLLILSQGEANQGRGEDSSCTGIRKNYVLLSVMDGCGGMGSRKYASFSDMSGAYMASRTAAGSMLEWMREHPSIPDDPTGSVQASLLKFFGILKQNAGPSSRIAGSMVRSFPTTLAMLMAEPDHDGWILHALWAGDSRVYVLNREGLSQISLDDTAESDALQALYNDPPLQNVLSADGGFEIRTRKVKVREPFLAFCATDGCFGYVPSPMHFEMVIEKAFLDSSSIEEFEAILQARLRETAGDDYTLALAGFGFQNLEELRGTMKDRYSLLSGQFPEGQKPDRDLIAAYWKERYQPVYEQFWEDQYEGH